MRNNTISITTKKNSTRKINGTAKYDMTNLGYGSFPPIEIYKNSPISRTKSTAKPEFAILLHLIKVLAGSYKSFLGRRAIRLTLCFEGRKNEMEVL